MAYRANSGGGRDEQPARPLYETYASDPVPNERQQNKLIAVTLDAQPSLFYEREITLKPGERELFINRYLDDPAFASEAWRSVSMLQARYKSMTGQEIIRSIQEYPQAKQAFTLINFAYLDRTDGLDLGPEFALSRAFERRDNPKAAHIDECIGSAPDVVTFTKKVARAMEQIERVNGPAKANEYLTSYRVAAGILYGKQLEYMDQLLFLEQEVESARRRTGREQDYRRDERDPRRDYKEDPDRSGSRARGASEGRASGQGAGNQQGGSYQQRQESPRAEKARPVDVGGFSSGGEVKKRKVGENDYENNDSGVGGVVSYVRSMNQVPFVIEGRTDYKIYQTPGTSEYLTKLKSDPAFAEGQVKAVAKAMKERVIDAGQVNGSNRSPTSRFHLRMQGLFHPDSMNRYSDNSAPTEHEKDIRSELFKAYQEIVAKNPSAEFYGLA